METEHQLDARQIAERPAPYRASTMGIATALRQEPATAPAVRQLHQTESINSAHQPLRVALLIEDGFPSETLRGLVSEFGWSWHIILADDLDTSPAVLWDLIIIATDGRTMPVAPICAKVSRDARQRVLIISQDRSPQSIADALNAGADDYVIAPFDPDECRARMKALMFRSGDPSRSHRQLLWTEPLSRTIGIGERYVSLSPREWNVIVTLLEADQEPVEPVRLGQCVWGTAGQPSTLASTVSRLRQKLRANHLYGIDVVTVRGHGYAIRQSVATSRTRQATHDEHSRSRPVEN